MNPMLDPFALPLRGVRLIEASAGTGKTYTIATLYLRLVLAHGNGSGKPLMPPSILVVTFTNAATEELRERIRFRLNAAADCFGGAICKDDTLLQLRDAYAKAQWPACVGLLRQAAQWMDEAAIFTIHGFCQRMLRQHAFDSGAPFDLEVDVDDAKVLLAAACDYWRKYYYPLSPDQLQQLADIVHWHTPQMLVESVRPCLRISSMPVVEAPMVLLTRRDTAIDKARRIWQESFEEAVALLRHARSEKILDNRKYRQDFLENWIEQFRVWAQEKGDLPAAKILEKFSAQGLGQGCKQNRSAPAHPAFQVLDHLIQTLKDLDLPVSLRLHAASEIQRRYDLEKERQGKIGFDDLISQLHAALHKKGPQQISRTICQRYPVALVDEFQDTDPLQYEIFKNIYHGSPSSGLLMIGDPKQAIYAFRGADIHTYLAARKLASKRRYRLGRNYRSTQSMVQAVNRLFEPARAYPQGPFLFGDQIPFESMQAQGRDDDLFVAGQKAKAMQFWQLAQTQPVPKNGEQGYLQQMADAAAAEMVRLLHLSDQGQAGFGQRPKYLKPLRPKDMAVLVRTGQEAQIIRRAMHRRRLSSVYLSDKASITEGWEIQSLLYLLRACRFPENDANLKTALASQVLDLPLHRLDRFHRDENLWATQVERFYGYQQIWQERGVLPMLHQLLFDYDVPARLLASENGERTLTNVLHLAELLQAAAVEQPEPEALIRWLSELKNQSGTGVDEQILRLESDAERIRVVTIHKAKGLEYPLVFLPFVCNFRAVLPGNKEMVVLHDPEGKRYEVIRPDKADNAAADSERLAEDLRLLYVAVTRSRYACWLGIGVLKKARARGDKNDFHQSALGYLLTGGEPMATADLSTRLQAIKGDGAHIQIRIIGESEKSAYHRPDASKGLQPARPFGGQIDRSWWIASYSGIVAESGGTPKTSTRKTADAAMPSAADSAAEDQFLESSMEPVEPILAPAASATMHTFPRGPQPGTFLHAILETAAVRGFDRLTNDAPQVKQMVLSLGRQFGYGQWALPLADWLMQFLKLKWVLPSEAETVALADLSGDGYQPELEFMLAAHKVDIGRLDATVRHYIVSEQPRPALVPKTVNGMLKGFIDLVFCHRNRYYLVDYKSNHLGDSDEAYRAFAMTACIMEHRYDLQYALYTLALHRLLQARLGNYDYEKHMGGVMYVFLRGAGADGTGIYNDRPPLAMINEMDKLFAEN